MVPSCIGGNSWRPKVVGLAKVRTYFRRWIQFCLLYLDRKIRCDRGLPICSNCVRSKRDCRGYGIRLSWPAESDEKRFVVVKPVSERRRSQIPRSSNVSFINASFWDMEMHSRLSTSTLNSVYGMLQGCAWAVRKY
jgi:hypothetical protein